MSSTDRRTQFLLAEERPVASVPDRLTVDTLADQRSLREGPFGDYQWYLHLWSLHYGPARARRPSLPPPSAPIPIPRR